MTNNIILGRVQALKMWKSAYLINQWAYDFIGFISINSEHPVLESRQCFLWIIVHFISKIIYSDILSSWLPSEIVRFNNNDYDLLLWKCKDLYMICLSNDQEQATRIHICWCKTIKWPSVIAGVKCLDIHAAI